jgi:hypothetical protein
VKDGNIIGAFAVGGIIGIIIFGLLADLTENDCKTAYYEMWSVKRCINTTGCFTLRDDLHEAKQASLYYDANCAQYEQDRINELPKATINPSSSKGKKAGDFLPNGVT